MSHVNPSTSSSTQPHIPQNQSMVLHFLLPLFGTSMLVVGTLQNTTIDDTDTSMIIYAGKWDTGSPSALDYGGSHMYSEDSTATAIFTFTGVDVYYLAPRWPYGVYTRLRIDGGASDLVNLTDPNPSSSSSGMETVNSSVAWSATNLANTSHSVLVTFGTYAIVDGFIYTVDNGASPVSSGSISAPSTSTSTSASAASSFSDKGLVIGLTTGLSIAVLVSAALTLRVLYRRRRNLRRPTPSTQFRVDDSSMARTHPAVSPSPQMAFVIPFSPGSTSHTTGSSRHTSGKSVLQNNSTFSGATEPSTPPPYYSV